MGNLNGIAIAIAWPEFMGKQAGSWYDPLMRFLGFNKNFHYQVGHASLVLINDQGKCHYFDCGRYEAPYQKGRIRDSTTDCGLTISTRAQLENNQIKNIDEILIEIQLNKTCKGFGHMESAYCQIHFETAFAYVKAQQKKGLVNFGPFIIPGTNCCRFVQEGIAKGKPRLVNWIKLRLLFPFWPKPKTIIVLLPNKKKILARKYLTPEGFELFDTIKYYSKSNVNEVLCAPPLPPKVPDGSKWLSGEMAGSWFHIKSYNNNTFLVNRFDEYGDIKCNGKFINHSAAEFDPNENFLLRYPSHCDQVLLDQDGLQIYLQRFKPEHQG